MGWSEDLRMECAKKALRENIFPNDKYYLHVDPKTGGIVITEKKKDKSINNRFEILDL